MKKILITVLTICCIMQLQLASAQTAELEQLTLDIEKLAQFKQILGDLQKGYDIINNGYSTISGISQGTFDLHQGFLNGLMAVSPAVRNYVRVAEIINYQKLLLSEYKSAYTGFKSGGRFTPDEISYMGTVYSSLFNQSVNSLTELTTVITDSKLRMSDAERLQQIDRIDRDMQDKLSFLRVFNKRNAAVDAQRARQQQDNKRLQQLYGQ